MPPHQLDRAQQNAPCTEISSIAGMTDPQLAKNQLACEADVDVTPAHKSLGDAAKPARRVSWPDMKGGNLCDVREFLKTDQVWLCSSSDASPLSAVKLQPPVSKLPPRDLVEFQGSLPSCDADLVSDLAQHGVRLESALVRCPTAFVTIRVLNASFHKRVYIRHTADGWATFRDTEAVFGSSTGTSDRFFSTVCVPNYNRGTTVEFAVCYSTGEREYWDNNGGRNYRLIVSAEQSSVHHPQHL